MHIRPFFVTPILLLSAIAAGAQLGTCPYVIANYPFTATMVMIQTVGTLQKTSIPIARDRSGNVRCGVPQFGREADPLELVDVEHKQDIIFGCAAVVSDARRSLFNSCQGQRVQVRSFTYRAPVLSDAEVERRIQELASTPASTRSEGTLKEETRTLGQRFVNGVPCVGFQVVRRGIERAAVRQAETQQQPVNYESEYCISPLYGTVESSSSDRVRNVRDKMELQDLRLGDPPHELLELPPEYAETFTKALASPEQTASTPAPAR